MTVIRKASEVARTTPDGYVHPQYLPTVWKILRRIPGMSMEGKVRKEVVEMMDVLDEDRGLDGQMFRSLANPEDRFYYAFGFFQNNFWDKVDPETPRPTEDLDRYMGPSIRAARKKVEKEPDKHHSIPKSVKERRTVRQFDEDINRAVKEAGMDMEEYRKLEYLERDKRSPDKVVQMARMLYPVYVKLREWGYSNRDLQ